MYCVIYGYELNYELNFVMNLAGSLDRELKFRQSCSF